ncbi:hypothetical protein R6Z07F_004504 [Ovis aries]
MNSSVCLCSVIWNRLKWYHDLHFMNGIRPTKLKSYFRVTVCFPDVTAMKNLPANAEDTSSLPGSGRSSGEGNGNPLQYPCLGNPMDRGSWRATVHGVTKESDMN